MVSVKNRTISRAVFHAAVAVGQRYINVAFPGLNTVTKVDLTEMGVMVTSVAQGRTFEVLVPFADVVSMDLVPLEKAPDKE